MIKISQLKADINYTDEYLKKKIEKELSLKHIFNDVPDFTYKILRRSIDARKKPDIFYVFSLAIDFNNTNSKDFDSIILKKCKNRNISKYDENEYIPRVNVNLNEALKKRPVIIGEGPCGLFAGLILARAGLKPVIIERGDKVDKRVDKVGDFWLTGSIDENTNVQYGEGGAGTFSDGKLNTLVKDKSGKNRFVLETFVEYGANKQCAFDAHPHVGTDVLREVVTNIRNEINRLNGQIIHLCKMTELVIENEQIIGLYVDNLSGKEIKLTSKLASKGTYIETLKQGLNFISTCMLGLPQTVSEAMERQCRLTRARTTSEPMHVNGAYKNDSSDIGKLMHDFRCTSSIDMFYDVLKRGMHHFKETEGGRTIVCRAIETYGEQMALKRAIENAKKMIAGGKLTLEEIAEYSGLSLEKVRELADKRTA